MLIGEDGRPYDFSEARKTGPAKNTRKPPYGYPIYFVEECVTDPTSDERGKQNLGGFQIWQAEAHQGWVREGRFLADEYRYGPGTIYEVQNGVAVKTGLVMRGMVGENIIVQDPSRIGIPGGKATIMP